MRKVRASTFVTLDGVMQAPGGPDEDPTGGFAHGGWTVNYWDDGLSEAMDGLFANPFDLLLGRRTYDIFAAYWPYVEGERIADQFNAVNKFVATHSPEPLAWQNSIALTSDVPAEIRRLKQEEGPDLLIQGSSVLIHSLLPEGLIDEFQLLIFPLVLGTGKRLFGDGAVPSALRLVESRASATGVMIGRYVPAGAVETGSFALEEPSRAEIARREKLKAEEMS